MFIKSAILLGLSYLSVVLSKEITDVKYSGLSYSPAYSVLYPDQGWIASFDFSISDTSSIAKGDTFSLSMPYVYRVKFDDNDEYIAVPLNNGTNAFQCTVSQQAAYLNEDTILTCTALTDLSSYSSIDGALSFVVVFNSGGSAYQYELADASFFSAGTMDVPLGDQMSAPITFSAAPEFTGAYSIGRSTTFGYFESYYVGMQCPNGYLVGGAGQINYDIADAGYSLDCSSVQVNKSGKFNDWFLPEDSEDSGADVNCFNNELWFTVGEEQSGEMIWVNALQSVPVGYNTISHDINLQYTCMDTMASTTYTTSYTKTRVYVSYEGVNSATATAVLKPNDPLKTTTTTPWTGTYTTTYSTESTYTTGTDGSSTPEIIIHVETPNTVLTSTTTTPWTGTYTTTYSTESTYTTGTDGSSTPEIIIHVETPNTVLTSTTTTPWTGTYTTTYSTESTYTTGTDGSSTPEIIIHVETPNTVLTSTTTTPWTGTYTTTYSTESTYTTGTDGSSTPEIIIHVETPNTNITVTSTTSSISLSTDITTSSEKVTITTTNISTTISTITSCEGGCNPELPTTSVDTNTSSANQPSSSKSSTDISTTTSVDQTSSVPTVEKSVGSTVVRSSTTLTIEESSYITVVRTSTFSTQPSSPSTTVNETSSVMTIQKSTSTAIVESSSTLTIQKSSITTIVQTSSLPPTQNLHSTTISMHVTFPSSTLSSVLVQYPPSSSFSKPPLQPFSLQISSINTPLTLSEYQGFGSQLQANGILSLLATLFSFILL
ncbi:hypothetical protein NCAS_0A01430 [Naumovozyma castellii]|uniref:Agglutinin-like protein N-terminal domain-containing protein n=1 Tax=Naumovozyma castellii TaxID=27288 RepID=G0V5G5_NAUCA|nr:hypothetical protein NCAS_0A01430 [Naumovozyma castellii CBS 4309]CCC66701.1 hypothetical protein NCAS_0A01430 [Naumovozyma castellii CBS 4309]